VEPADDLAGLRIADEHGERSKIVVSDLAQIVGAETIGDHRHVGRIKLIGHGDVWLCLGIAAISASDRTGLVGGERCRLPRLTFIG